MIFKGFTDENGNVIPVQGAGTVYNEEKNSLALGKDTVAIGQDQLVFGRKNIVDEEKAEIVGGGAGTEPVIESMQPDLEYVGYMNLSEFKTFYYEFWTNTPGLPEMYPISDNFTLTLQIYVSDKTIINDDSVRFFVFKYKVGETNNPLVIIKESDMFSSASLKIGYQHYTYTGDAEYTEGSTFKINSNGFNVKYTEPAKNIRTLDWNGNEELAGYLKTDKLVFKNVTVIEGVLEEREVTANEAFLMPVIKRASSRQYTLKNYADDTDTINWSFPVDSAIEFAHTHLSQACMLLTPAGMGLVEWRPACGWGKFNSSTLWKSCQFRDDEDDGARYMYEASIVCSAYPGVLKHLFLKKEDYVTGTIKYYHYEPSQE